MTVRVGTVLSVRDWEPGLVAAAHDSALVRIVVRAFRPQDLDVHLDAMDVVVVGGDTAWLTPVHVRTWKSAGVAVLGVVPAGDRPAADLLASGGADEVVPDSIPIDALVQAIRFIQPGRVLADAASGGRTVGVTGTRGAPGCTEVAVAYAASVADDGSALLIDADVEAPAVAIRLGLAPRPDLLDAIDGVRSEAMLDPVAVHTVGPLGVVVGPHRGAADDVRPSHVESVIRAARQRYDTTIVDLGTSEVGRALVEDLDATILVADASALGIVRAARLVERWMGPAPALVLNRVDPSARERSIEAARRWTGLEPAVVVRDRRAVRRAACSARAPDRRFARAVGRLGWVS